MRVVYLNPAAELGGAERSLLDLVAGVRACLPELDPHVVTAVEGPLLDLAAARGVGVEVVAMPRRLLELGDSALSLRGGLGPKAALVLRGGHAALGLGGYARALRRAVGRLAPDIIHSNSLKTHALTPALVGLGAPVVWHLRDFLSQHPLVRRTLRMVARGAALGIAISRAVAAEASAALPRLRTEVVYNAVDADAFAPAAGERDWLDLRAGVAPPPAGTVRVGLVATYGRWKGHDVFLRAAASARQRGAPARFYVIGGPLYRTHGSQFGADELRSLAEALGLRLGLDVVFLPFLDEPVHAYRGLDVVVHASTRPEPFGRTIAEAMACGRAVVVAAAGGAAELFTHGHDAIGVEPGRPEALADAVEGLARDPALRARLAAAAVVTARARFALPRLGAEMARIYRDVAARRR